MAETLPEDIARFNSASSFPEPKRRLNSRRRMIFLCLLSGLVIALGGLGVFWRPNNKNEAPQVPVFALDTADSQVREAVTIARDMVVADPKSAHCWGHLGVVLTANDFSVEAVGCLEQAARLDPNDARWPYYLGITVLPDDPDRGVSLLRRAAKLDLDSEQGRTALNLRLAEALLDRQLLDEAESILQRELQASADNPHARYDMALLALARGKWADAKSLFLKLADSPFVRRKAAGNLAAIERRVGNDASADRIEKDLRQMPEDLDWVDSPLDSYIQGRVVGLRSSDRMAGRFRQSGKYDEAIRITVANAQSHPRVDTYSSAATTLAENGNFEPALYYLRKALELDANYAEGHYLIASIRFYLAEKESKTESLREQARGHYRDAIAHARRAVAIKPDYGIAYYYLGRALCRIDELPEGIEQLRMAVKCRPELPSVHLFLAEALWEDGKKTEAIKCACVARELYDPKDLRFKKDYEQVARTMNDSRLKPLDDPK